MADENGEKTHDATAHRLQQAREQGQTPRSQDLTSAALLVVALGIIWFGGSAFIKFFGDLTRHQLGSSFALSTDVDGVVGHWQSLITSVSWIMLPLLGGLFIVAVVVNIGQVGFLFLPQKVKLDINNINPMKGVKRIISLANVVKLGFGIFKVLIVCVVAVASLWSSLPLILALGGASVGEAASFIANLLLWTALKIAGALFVLAIADYAFQRWKHSQDLKMTTQELREEMKTLQGDPQVASRRRQVQRQLALDRLGTSVPEADVIVTNPTELAIAIKYDFETMPTPIVVAKGAGVIAARIRRLGLENGIPIVERKPLARALYKEVEVGDVVPTNHFAAVAEVLRYVYELQGRTIPQANQ